MGNCCTNEERKDENFQMQNSVGGGKRKRVRNQARESGDHEPKSTDSITQVPEMNRLNPAVEKATSELKPFNPKVDEKEFDDLPTLGPYKYEDGSTYEGQYYEGMRCGYGKCIWPEGFYYEGYWDNDQRNGKGRLVHEEGDIYEGDWVEGKAEGYGEYKHTDGTYYKGAWIQDQQHGQGREVWDDGSIYEGEYKNGMKNGKGKFTWIDGSSYEGDFVDNNLEGQGEFNFLNFRGLCLE